LRSSLSYIAPDATVILGADEHPKDTTVNKTPAAIAEIDGIGLFIEPLGLALGLQAHPTARGDAQAIYLE
jgi:hypothetical protein